MDKNKVVLVDENDNKVGLKEKLQTHIDGDLHRAFSILLFNSDNEMLLQRRAESKYHSGGLWSNTCCSHPMDGEDILDAGVRRLQEEMNIDCNNLEHLFSFIYKTELENLTEHEFDHVLAGSYNKRKINLNPKEASDYRWVSIEQLKEEISRFPGNFTAWFKIIVNEHENELVSFIKDTKTKVLK